jgi:hypothetical protein
MSVLTWLAHNLFLFNNKMLHLAYLQINSVIYLQ